MLDLFRPLYFFGIFGMFLTTSVLSPIVNGQNIIKIKKTVFTLDPGTPSVYSKYFSHPRFR